MFTCHFCCRLFEELPFWGCCSRCYCGSEAVRKIVDDAHPQTVHPLPLDEAA